MAEKLCKRKGKRWRKRKRRKGKDGRWVATRRRSEVEVGKELHGDSEVGEELHGNSQAVDSPCVICYEELGEDTLPLKCGHVLHKECFLNLLPHQNTCPTCRRETFPEVRGLTIVTSRTVDITCHSCNKDVRSAAGRLCEGCREAFCSGCFPTTQIGLGRFCRRCLSALFG